MHVSDIMTTSPVTIDQNSTLYGAMETMQRMGCHHLPVISADRHFIGIISDHDCRRALSIWDDQWRESKLAQRMLVRAVMTPAPIVIEADAPAYEAARLMLASYIRCLPVMRGETLIGIITTSDLLIAFMNLDKGSDDNGHESVSSLRKRSWFNR
ncbi:MAG: CBS domain-containing protein [Chloroflexi bacterium]|nr:CBS domain-containing protein [Chloroflexota bacterium]